MAFRRVKLRPTVDRESTRFGAGIAAFDTAFCRIRNRFFEKIGGWVKFATATFDGTCRTLHSWVLNTGAKVVGVGTHKKFYVLSGGAYYNATPTRKTSSLGSNPVAMVNTSKTITVSDTSHGARAGDYVTAAGLSGAVNGIPEAELEAELEILTLVDADSWTAAVATTAATSTGSGGGSSVVLTYQLHIGLDDSALATGYGVVPWGGEYNGAATNTGYGIGADTSSIIAQLRLWSQDHFGEDLIFCPRGGKLYYWDASSGFTGNLGLEFSTITGANKVPKVVNWVQVSELDGHVVAYGVDNEGGDGTIRPKLVRWSSQNTIDRPTGYLDWETRGDNTARGQELEAGSEIIRPVKTRQETLVLMDNAIYSQTFVGPPVTFRFRLLSDTIGIIGPLAAVDTPVGVIFMAARNFYLYNGALRPIPCSVRKYVFDDINTLQAYKALVGHNVEFNEVWFFWVSSGATEIDRYAIWNYGDEEFLKTGEGWTIGLLERTAWEGVNLETNRPIAAKSGLLYDHEKGTDDVSSALTAYVESGDLVDEENLDEFLLATRIIVDVTYTGGTKTGTIELIGRDFEGQTSRSSGTFIVTNTIKDLRPRVRARRISLKFQTTGTDVGWRTGDFLPDVQSDGSV